MTNEENNHPDDPAMELPEIPATQVDETTSAPQASDEVKLEQAPKARRSGWLVFAAAAALVAVGAGVGSATTYAIARKYANQLPIGFVEARTSPGVKAIADVPFDTGNVIPTIYRKASPSVVKIRAEVTRGTGRTGAAGSTGSGFVIDPRGYIMTNQHVVNGATKITVGFVDGTTLVGTVVGTDKYKDLAVIKVDPGPRSLIAIPLGDSDSVQVGELAVAIGSPFGNDYTITAGIVSGLNRSIREEDNPFDIPGAIQTDAAINPGNSGGPLINAAGEVIGINTAIESPLRGSVGIGFAVPINAAKEILPSLIAGKKVEYPWLGVGVQDIDSTTANQLGTNVTRGALVTGIYRNSPAAQAGLKPVGVNRSGTPVSGDVLVDIDGKAISGSKDLVEYLRTKKVGEVISMTVARGKERVVLSATLAARPENLTEYEDE